MHTMTGTAALIEGLAPIVGSDAILAGAAALRAYDCDAYTVERSKPMAIVVPQSTQQVADIVRWCNQTCTPFTARGAGTGLSGGAMPALGGVVLSTKRLTKILEVDLENSCMLAQTGIANRKISEAVKEFGLHFAPDPSSQTVSTLGGNIAENAGGPHTLKYGVTTQHIHGVTLVDPQGEIVQLGGRLSGSGTLDWVSLACGSEGTLGIVTEAWVRLTPLPTAVETVLVSFPTIRQATECVAQIVGSGILPAALEMLDRGVLQAVAVAFQLQYHPDAQALLLVECDAVGADASTRARQEIELVEMLCRKLGALEVERAVDDRDRQRLWTARKKGVGAMGRLAPSIVTHDGVIPRSKLPEMLDRVFEIATKHSVNVANIFHAGDGNLHPCFYFDDRDPKQVEAVVAAGEEIIFACLQLGGSITGEHGVGVEKSDLMALMFQPEDLALQMKIKRLFDLGDLCNPCKMLPNQKGCTEHRRRWKGAAW
jgi:glycolate oxidase